MSITSRLGVLKPNTHMRQLYGLGALVDKQAAHVEYRMEEDAGCSESRGSAGLTIPSCAA